MDGWSLKVGRGYKGSPLPDVTAAERAIARLGNPPAIVSGGFVVLGYNTAGVLMEEKTSALFFNNPDANTAAALGVNAIADLLVTAARTDIDVASLVYVRRRPPGYSFTHSPIPHPEVETPTSIPAGAARFGVMMDEASRPGGQDWVMLTFSRVPT